MTKKKAFPIQSPDHDLFFSKFIFFFFLGFFTEMAKQLFNSIINRNNNSANNNSGNDVESWKFFEKKNFDVIPWIFDGQKWNQSKIQSTSTSSNIPNTLSIVSYNVWFDNFECIARWQAILEILTKLRPNVIGFQECTETFMNLLISNDFIRQNYLLSDISTNLWEARYGICLLIQKEIATSTTKIKLHKLPTQMGRNAILATLNFTGEHSISFGTVHLESLSNKQRRRDQLAILSEIYSNINSQSSLLFGDFNFDSVNPFLRKIAFKC